MAEFLCKTWPTNSCLSRQFVHLYQAKLMAHFSRLIMASVRYLYPNKKEKLSSQTLGHKYLSYIQGN